MDYYKYSDPKTPRAETRTGVDFMIGDQEYQLQLTTLVPDDDGDFLTREITALPKPLHRNLNEGEKQTWIDELNEKTGCNFKADNFSGR